MGDESDLKRFLVAQEAGRCGYQQALREIVAGRKLSHWIWYVFPQLKGLGRSANSRYYGLDGRREAEAYLADPVLGARLREISRALLSHAGTPARDILGGIDAVKVRSCMTLFDCIAPGDVFAEVLDAFYDDK